LYIVEKAKLMPKNKYLRTSVELFFIMVELYLAAPMAIAMYP
jgi:hypothetical protein